jgi:hypothetical protein
VPTKFFRVDGADQETGEETYLVLRAKTRPQAEKLARDQGLLIASVRIASPEDWAATAEHPPTHAEPAAEHAAPTEEDPTMHAPTHADSVSHVEEQHEPAPEHFVDAAPATEPSQHYAAGPARALARRSPTGAAPSAAGPIVLACSGAAFIIGGVLALVLALRPDNSIRNDLQQLDYRLQSLIQTTLGSMLVVSGLIVCLIAVLCYLLPRRSDS